MNEPAARMPALIGELFPVCRSIMGPGTRHTLDRIGADIPIVRRGVPSGATVLDWVVPDEWTIAGAVLSPAGGGERIVDFADSNLHVVSHSVPVVAQLSLDELQPHLHSLPDRPHLVPYRTSYYAPGWGLCLADEVRARLRPGSYDVVVDSCLRPGLLEWGELLLPGRTDEEVLFSTHVCHPSMANDNLSGIAVLVELARAVAALPRRRYSYRFLFVPGTIGAIAWLATTPVDRVRLGLVVTGLGDPAPFTYKRSRRGDTEIDRIMAVLLRDRPAARVVPFDPYGYDERQYCSPGFDLAVGRLTRGVHGQYPEYHTSGDDLAFVSAGQLAGALELLVEAVDAIETNRRYVNVKPHGEPQLGRYGLYSPVGAGLDQRSVEMAQLWLLSESDGHHDLVSVAERSGIGLAGLAGAADRLEGAGLLTEAR